MELDGREGALESRILSRFVLEANGDSVNQGG